MKIMGVRIDEVDRGEAREKVRHFLNSNDQHTIFTPNPEMLVDAQIDNSFLNALNLGSLNICDGRGLEFVSSGKLNKISGVDFMQDICKIAQEEEKRVYLLGSGDKDVIENTKDNLNKIYPGLFIVGTNIGPNMSVIDGELVPHSEDNNDLIIDDIIARAPDIIFVGFGHNKQEKWINRYIKELPSVKVMMGVGGSFDMISGKIKRAPKIMRRFGLEWIWRLIREPWRAPRIWKATIKFLWIYYVKTPN